VTATNPAFNLVSNETLGIIGLCKLIRYDAFSHHRASPPKQKSGQLGAEYGGGQAVYWDMTNDFSEQSLKQVL
jgi:hypothetical protein